MRLRLPVHATEAVDALELREVACHHDEPARAGMSCDQKIIAADWEPLPLQRRPDIGGMIRRCSVESQNLKSARKALDLAPVMIWPG